MLIQVNRRIGSLLAKLLVIVLFVSVLQLNGWTPVKAVQAQMQLHDIESSYAKQEIEELVAAGIISGYEDGSFAPANPITRGEIAKIIVSMLKLEPKPEKAGNFQDVAEDSWYRGYVGALVDAGITQGVSETAFSPNSNVTREEMIVLFIRAFGLEEKALQWKSDVTWSDAEQISGWARAYIDFGYRIGFVQGIANSDGSLRFDPGSRAERQAIARLAFEFVSKLQDFLTKALEVLPAETPSAMPTTTPSASPTPAPTTSPTTEPTTSPATEPTMSPTTEPTTSPTTEPTTSPTTEPTSTPTSTPTSEPTTSPEPPLELGSIAGLVADTASAPLAGANVQVTGTSLSAVTDSAGAYAIHNVPVGSHTVTVTKTAYAPYQSSSFQVTDGGTAAVNVTLERMPDLSIVENGQAQSLIIVEPSADNQTKAAANKLAAYVKKSTNDVLPVLTTTELSQSGNLYDNKVRIYVGTKAPQTQAAITNELQGMADHGFVLWPHEQSISIIGPTAWGTEFGVDEFLERYVGVRWLLPGPDGEDVPLTTNLAVPFEPVKDEPDAISRHFFGMHFSATVDWARDNRIQQTINFHHNMNVLFDPVVFADHPEYYPNGVLPTHAYNWQPCFTNETAQAAIARIIQYFNQNPNEVSYSLGINDGVDNFCESNPNHPNYPGKTNSMGALNMSDIYYPWVNQVAEGVLAVHPDKYFGLLAYLNVYDPPTVPLNPRVIPFITDDRMTWVLPENETTGKGQTALWEAKATNIGFYEYLYGASYNLPRMYMQQMAENYKYAQDHKVIAHVAELYPNFGEGPKPWVSAKLQWNPNLDVNELEDEWYERAVGTAAAPYLKQYYEYWETFWTTRIFQSSWYQAWVNAANKRNYLNVFEHSYLEIVTKEDIAESRRLLELAVANAGAGKQKTRAQLLLRAFEYYEASALSYTKKGTINTPADEQAAMAMLDDIEKSYAMAKKRKNLLVEFAGHPVLDRPLKEDAYAGVWDGVQRTLIDAVQRYVNTEPANGNVRPRFYSILSGLDSYSNLTASAVRTTASQATILQSLDFSQGPWTAAIPFSEFSVMGSKAAAPVETKVYLLWDNENLYVGYENFDSEVLTNKLIKSTEAPNNWWKSGQDDSVETYVTGDTTSYKGFFTNPNAVKFVYKKGPTPDLDTQWQASAQIGTDRWNTIQVIPFSSIGVNPAQTNTLKGFFFRAYHGSTKFLGWDGGAPWKDDSFRPIHLVEPTNYLQNSSFELGNPQNPSEITLPWRYSGAAVTQRTYEYAHTGEYSLVTSGVDEGAGPYQYTGVITPGKYKAVLYYYLPTDATTPGSIQLWTNIIKSGGGKIADVRTDIVPFFWAKGQWRKLEYIFEVKSTYNGVAPYLLQPCVVIRDFKTTTRLYIDDFSLYKLAN
ncbi:DUF4838 domain-containing protein [Paenibacillus contaminans]|uniref:SLH domain-containing protein n=1 Tax=Paenibacillus contaminans TaxID=450362 RepID=A0A329ML51_9BACL|nr:DUF4838 domain-containing protein [Paenibacillus contaminans]RAV20298.1 hypothetical protein DQG23_15075 [Paenibacillus contaminans]